MEEGRAIRDTKIKTIKTHLKDTTIGFCVDQKIGEVILTFFYLLIYLFIKEIKINKRIIKNYEKNN